MERFSRTELLLGKRPLEKLHNARVAVFGLGAVGSFALESLVRSGVGEFFLTDFDEVRPTNFNRQLYALESNIGKAKVEIARKRILEINPQCKVTVYAAFADKDNLADLLKPAPDLVIDAIDSLNPKADLIEYCVKNKLSVISSLGAGKRTDPFSIRIGDISEARRCPLARHLKMRLKKRGITHGVRCVYSTQAPLKGTHALEKEEDSFRRGRMRAPVGTVSYMTGMFGLMIAFEAMHHIVGDALHYCGNTAHCRNNIKQ